MGASLCRDRPPVCRLDSDDVRLLRPVDDQLGDGQVEVAFGLLEQAPLGEGGVLLAVCDEHDAVRVELHDLVADRLDRVGVADLALGLDPAPRSSSSVTRSRSSAGGSRRRRRRART